MSVTFVRTRHFAPTYSLTHNPYERPAMKRSHEPTPDEIRPNLWNDSVGAAEYSDVGESYRGAILEQYKLYVEMADRISARRGLTNTFFLSLNTAIFALFGALWKDSTPKIAHGVAIALLAAVLAECGSWWLIVRSYRQLNSAKYKVVGLLEERLPASPYWSAEWSALRQGEDPRLYLPLSHVEQVIPLLFAALYIVGCVLIVTT
jgi:hypothetical protein